MLIDLHLSSIFKLGYILGYIRLCIEFNPLTSSMSSVFVNQHANLGFKFTAYLMTMFRYSLGCFPVTTSMFVDMRTRLLPSSLVCIVLNQLEVRRYAV